MCVCVSAAQHTILPTSTQTVKVMTVVSVCVYVCRITYREGEMNLWYRYVSDLMHVHSVYH